MTLVLTLVYEGLCNRAPSLSTVSGLWRHHASWLLGLHTNGYLCLICSFLPLHLTKTYPLGHFFKKVRSPFRTLWVAKYVPLSCLAEGVFQVHPHQRNIKGPLPHVPIPTDGHCLFSLFGLFDWLICGSCGSSVLLGLSLLATSWGYSRCGGFPCGAQSVDAQPSVVAAPGLWSTGPTAVAHWLSCSVACGIFPGQGSNPCQGSKQVYSLPLSHQGSPPLSILNLGHFAIHSF